MDHPIQMAHELHWELPGMDEEAPDAVAPKKGSLFYLEAFF